MARQSVDKVANAKWPQGRQVIWTEIRRLGAGDALFTTPDIWEGCGREIPRDTVRDYVRALHAGGFLEQVTASGPRKAATYRIVGKHGAEAPRVRPDGSIVTQGAGTEAMWRTIKVLGTFSAAELALTASTDVAPVTEETAKTYLRYLERAGFVRCVVKGKPGRGGNKDRWNFVKSRDPGPLPPQIQRIKQVFDPNSNSVVWPKESRS